MRKKIPLQGRDKWNKTGQTYLYRFLLFFFSFFAAKLYAEQPQAWVGALFPIGEFRKVAFSFWQQYRFESSNFKLVNSRYSLCLKKNLCTWLESEVHYTLIYSRKKHEISFNKSERLEFEINPHFKLTKKIELKLRNRYEFIHREDRQRRIRKFRQRHQIILRTNHRLLKNISIHNEMFYNVTDKKIDEYRFVPLEFGFEFGKQYNFNIYSMVRWRKPSTYWRNQYIFGISLRL